MKLSLWLLQIVAEMEMLLFKLSTCAMSYQQRFEALVY